MNFPPFSNRHFNLSIFPGSFERLENRVSQIETFLIKQDEHANNQQLKLIQTLEEIMKLIDNVSLGGAANEDENLGKKIDELNGNLKTLRGEIAELKADHDTIEVSFFGR